MTEAWSVRDAGHSKLVHWDNTEEWDGEGGGREFWDGGHMYICG